jgi:hypothetical protein
LISRPFSNRFISSSKPALRDLAGTVSLTQGATNGNLRAAGSTESNRLPSQFQYVVREEPGVQPPAQTLAIAAAVPAAITQHYVHRNLPHSRIWRAASSAAIRTLPGNGRAMPRLTPGPKSICRVRAGKDFDPTAGELTGSRHIPVAVARHPETVPPVAGSFIGPKGPAPILSVGVRVTAI